MSKIHSAIRKGKEIIVKLDYLPEREGEKASLYLLGKENQTVNKLLRSSGKGMSLVFPFFNEEEASLFVKACLQGTTKQTPAVLIMDRENPKTLFSFMIKSMLLPAAIVLFAAFLLKLCFSQEPMVSFRNVKAFFATHDSIWVQGEVVFSDRLLDKDKENITNDLKIKLKKEGKEQAESTIKEQIFYAKFPCDQDASAYSLDLLYKNSVLHQEKVNYDPLYPIVVIKNTRWDGRYLVVSLVQLNQSEQSIDMLLLSKSPDSPKETWVASEIYNKKNTMRLGPIQSYSPTYSLLIKTAQHIIAQKEIPYSIPVGQIFQVYAFELSSILVEGSWDGPQGTQVYLEILDKLTNSATQKVLVEKNFSQKLAVSPFQSEYIVQLKYGEEILSTLPVITSEAIKEYFLALRQMPAFLKALNNTSFSKENFSRIERIQKNSKDYSELFSDFSKKWQDEQEKNKALMLKEFYTNLGTLCGWILEEKDSQEWISCIVEKKYWSLITLLDTMTKVICHFHPAQKETNFFPAFAQSIKKREQEIQYKSWEESVYTFTREGKISLAINTCDTALKEFPDAWIFLLARYNLYRMEYHRLYLETYEHKAQEDEAKLLSLWRKMFDDLYKNNHKAKAYILGSQLMTLEGESKSLEHKIVSLNQSVSLKEKIETLLEMQKFQFPFILKKHFHYGEEEK